MEDYRTAVVAMMIVAGLSIVARKPASAEVAMSQASTFTEVEQMSWKPHWIKQGDGKGIAHDLFGVPRTGNPWGCRMETSS